MRRNNIGNSRNRNRHNAVLAAYGPLSFADAGTINTLCAEIVQAHRRADNVNNGIHRTNLVKMNLVNRQPVRFGFRFGDNFKNFDGKLFCVFGNAAVLNNMYNVVQIPVGMRMVVITCLLYTSRCV